MTHVSDEQLVLLAYDEAEVAWRDQALAHVADCADCRERLDRLERTRAAVEVAVPVASRRVGRRVAFAALAAAAVVAAVMLRPTAPVAPTTTLALPRYVAPELAPIDSILTGLEQQRTYANP
jgi:ribosomal protein L34E